MLYKFNYINFKLMSNQKNDIVEKIKDSLVKPPKFISENNKIDKFFENFYNKLQELEINYETVDISENYLINDICGLIDELIQLLNSEFKNNQNNDKTLPLSLNDMKLFDQFIKFITLQLIYRYLPSSIKPQSYLLTTDSKGIYGNYNQIKRCDNLKFFDLIVTKLISTFFDNGSNVGNNILKDCLRLSNFHYDIIIAIVYLISKNDDLNKHNHQWTILENEIKDTYDLYVNYSIWINYLNNAPALQKLLSTRVSNLIVLKNDGLKSLIEFILQIRETEEIELSKLSQLNELVMKRPSCCKTNKAYFSTFFDQVFEILELENNSNIIIAIMNILSTLFNKNIKIINDFFNKKLINKYLLMDKKTFAESKVPFHQVIKKFNVLITITNQNDSNFVQNLIEYYNEYDFMFLIYRYINFVYTNYKTNKLNKEIINEGYINKLINCLKFYLLCSNGKWYLINYLIMNYDFNSQNNKFGEFIVLSDKTFELSFITNISNNTEVGDVNSKIQNLQKFMKLQDIQNDLIIKVLETLIKNDDILTNVFVTILKRWCESYSKESDTDIFLQLNDLRIMNRLLELEAFKDEISQNSQNLLVVICDLLSLPTVMHNITSQDVADSDDEGEENGNDTDTDNNVLQMLLKLLSLILTSCDNFSKQNREQVENIKTKLVSEHGDSKASVSLVSRIVKILSNSNTVLKNETLNQNDDDDLSTDKIALKQALTNLNDPLPPIKAQGLYELRELILKESKVVDYGVVLELHLLEMKHKEPFVYLNSIKGLVILCQNNSSLEYLMKLYDEYDNKESSLAITFEEELRLGEVLSQFFQNKKYLINNDSHLHIIISIVLKKINTTNVNKLDNRIRMSAMSILGILIQVNMELFTESELIDCFNCIKGILTFEFDEKNDTFKLLRRSSIHLLNDMVYNSGLDKFVISFEEYENLINLLKYNKDFKEKDDLTIQSINKLLLLIDDIWKETYSLKEDTNDTLLSSLKIL